MPSSNIVLEALESRIRELEARVYGDAYKKQETTVVDSLYDVQKNVQLVAKSRDKVGRIMNKYKEVGRLLDLSMQEDSFIPMELKAELIVAEESLIQSVAKQLGEVQSAVEVLNSEHIHNVPQLSQKLQTLTREHLEQQESAAKLGNETAELLEKYNTALTVLSQQFISWDERLSQYEAVSKATS